MNPHHVVANELMRSLLTCNSAGAGEDTNGETPYAYDNTYAVARGDQAELNVYAHVHAALMIVLTRITNGNVDRAEMLRASMIDTEDVATSLAHYASEWNAQDRPVAVLSRDDYAGALSRGYAGDANALPEDVYHAFTGGVDAWHGEYWCVVVDETGARMVPVNVVEDQG